MRVSWADDETECFIVHSTATLGRAKDASSASSSSRPTENKHDVQPNSLI